MSLIFLYVIAALSVLLPTAYAAKTGAPWVPSRRAAVRRAFDVVGVGRGDVVIDLGAGDGTVLVEAARRGARAIGFELSPPLWLVAWLRSWRHQGVTVRYANFYKQSLTRATVIFMFLLPAALLRVRRLLAEQAIPQGRYVMSYTFPFRDVEALTVIREPDCAPLYVYDLCELTAQGDANVVN